jgi:hypothetical protein
LIWKYNKFMTSIVFINISKVYGGNMNKEVATIGFEPTTKEKVNSFMGMFLREKKDFNIKKEGLT